MRTPIERFEHAVRRTDRRFVVDKSAARRLREAFAHDACFAIPGMIDDTLLRKLTRNIARIKFEHVSWGKYGGEFGDMGSVMTKRLTDLMNDDAIFRYMRTVTRCEPILFFQGRIAWMSPAEKHSYGWHSDLNDKRRLIGMSLNLSRHPFGGGVFQLRSVHDKQAVHQLEDPQFGDAHFFKVSKDLEHRVTRITGAHPRLSFAGWFCGKFRREDVERA